VSSLSSDNIYCDECRKNTRKYDSIEKAKEIRRRKIKKVKNNKYVCKYCGEEICKRPDVCRKFTHKNVYEKYFEFDSNKKGTNDFYGEFDRIVNKLKEEYITNELSLPDIGKKYKINYQTVHMVFKSLNIVTRTSSEATINSIKNGKNTQDNFNLYPYKNGYHITWNNKKSPL